MESGLLLLVDDDPLIHALLSLELADAGFEIVAAHDAAQAFDALNVDAARFKAVVTDIRFGEGPNGWDVGRRARELVSSMPIIYISGDSSHEWLSQGVPESVMIAKPFAPAELVTAISTLIAKAGERTKD